MALDFSNLTVETVPVPVKSVSTDERETALRPLIQALAKDRANASVITVNGTDDKDVAKNANILIGALRRVANGEGVTARTRVDGTKVTVWVVDRQTRPGAGRKPAAETTDAAKPAASK